jgi:hypothetical protein
VRNGLIAWNHFDPFEEHRSAKTREENVFSADWTTCRKEKVL